MDEVWQGVSRAARAAWARPRARAGAAAAGLVLVLVPALWWATHPAALDHAVIASSMSSEGPGPVFFSAHGIFEETVTALEVVPQTVGAADFRVVACPAAAGFFGAVSVDSEPLLDRCVDPAGVKVGPFAAGEDDSMVLGVIGQPTGPGGGALCAVDVRYQSGAQRGWQRDVRLLTAVGVDPEVGADDGWSVCQR